MKKYALFVLLLFGLSSYGSKFSMRNGMMVLEPSILITNYYVSPNGSAANSGLSINSPWSFSYAVTNAPAGSVINLTEGLYTWSGVNNYIRTDNLTFRSIYQWKAIFTNITGTYPFRAWGVKGLVIDGIAFKKNQYYPVAIDGISNSVIRNCWFWYTGDGFAASQSASGIAIRGASNIVESCLSEYNGTNNSTYNHGIYGGGQGGIYRNNVCRKNGGCGIVLNAHGNGYDDGNLIYQNLCYSNMLKNYQFATIADSTGNVRTNFFFHNIGIETEGDYAIYLENNSTSFISNNIFVSKGIWVIRTNATTKAYCDYNLSTQPTMYAGPHDIVTNRLGFVNTNDGRFFLVANSPARNTALPTVFAPINFWSEPVVSFPDIGAFHYSVAVENITTTLDPSDINGAPYWTKP